MRETSQQTHTLTRRHATRRHTAHAQARDAQAHGTPAHTGACPRERAWCRSAVPCALLGPADPGASSVRRRFAGSGTEAARWDLCVLETESCYVTQLFCHAAKLTSPIAENPHRTAQTLAPPRAALPQGGAVWTDQPVRAAGLPPRPGWCTRLREARKSMSS